MTEVKPIFDPQKVLSKQEREDFIFVQNRIEELKDRKDQYGTDIEELWRDADKEYIPHRLKTRGKKVVATDDALGWRGSMVTLGTSDWQSDIAKPNPYIKMQTALAILIDQNPVGVFSASSKKYTGTSELMRQLYQRSWESAKSKQQLKLFVFNLAKYGWSIARTYPLYISRKVKVPTEFSQENPNDIVYEEKEIVEYNDLFRENLDPWNCWIDDLSKPNNYFSTRDWCWRKVYALDVAEEEFGKFDNWKYVTPGGTITEKISGQKSERKFKEKELIEIYFYENRLKDLFVVIANGVPIVIEPLPISDARGNKKLSCWHTYWTLRHAESPYGIGLYEAIRYDQKFLDRVRNMTIDQLVLSIYKMFFFQGTQSLTETGDIQIVPGTGKQVLDPKNINWLNVPGPGPDAYRGLEMFKKDVDEASGITDTLLGNITGKTAFEIAQAKEAALKRLKEPLNNILDALEQEGYITVSLIDILYSIPETYSISDPNLIEAYMNETQGDPDLYERDEQGGFTAKVYPEFALNLDKDEEGNLIETQETRFFRVKPRYLKWEGVINIKPQSILTPSKQVDKALDLEMYNMLIPLISQNPELYSKIGKAIVKLYDKDPKDILPDSWIVPQQQIPQLTQSSVVGGEQAPPEARVPAQAERLTTNTALQAQNPQSLGQRIVQRIAQPFRKV